MPEFAHHHNWKITINTYGDPERTKVEQRDRLAMVLALAFGAEAHIQESGQLTTLLADARRLAERVDELEHACRRQLRTGACAEIVAAVGLDTETNDKPVELPDPAYMAISAERRLLAAARVHHYRPDFTPTPGLLAGIPRCLFCGGSELEPQHTPDTENGSSR